MLKKDNLLWCMENLAGDIEITELYIFKLHNFCWNTLLDHHAISCKGWWTKHWPPVHGPRWTIQVNCLKIDQPSKILFYLSSIKALFFIFFKIKCSKKCARRDWSERVHYIPIKHAVYVTRVHCWDIMHAAYVIGTSARYSRYLLQKKFKKTCSSSIVELYEHLRTFKNTREVREALSFGSCLSALLSCS